MTKLQRYALIRKICRKLDKEKKQNRRNIKLVQAISRLDDRSDLYWKDEKSYADRYYGEVARETTKFDSEWN